MKPVLLLIAVAATALLATPAQSQTYPHVLEVVSVSRPGSPAGLAPNEVMVEVSYEVRSVMVHSRTYLVFLAATRGAIEMPNTPSAIAELTSRKGVLQFTTPVDAFVGKGANAGPIRLWAYLVDRDESVTRPQTFDRKLARSKPVNVYLAK